MPKGKGKSKGANKGTLPSRKLDYADQRDGNQFYGRVTKVFGHGQIQVVYYGKSANDEFARTREIRAMVRQRRGLDKLKVRLDGFVIISLREFQKGMGDVIHVYRENEEMALRKQREIPREIENASSDDEGDEAVVEFEVGEFEPTE